MQYVYAIVGGSMDDMYDFNVDDIGNRMGVCRPGNRYACYAANALNQHTCVTDYSTYPETEFFPAHDADGSQILIQAEAGIWDVAYNAVSRPVLFSGGDGVQVQFAYDHRGRCCERVESRLRTVISGGHSVSYWETVSHERYLYRGYLRIAALDMLNNAALIHAAVWDPTEPAATRPLLLQTPSGWFTYSFDQAKNVTELFDSAGGIAAAYDHGPFGEDMAATGSAAGLNPFRFSSEVWDGALALVCYNWRHYNPLDGRFISRDPIGERGGLNLYGFVGNDPVNRWDALGLFTIVGKAENFSHDEIQKAIADGFSNNIGAIREPLQHAVRENWGNMTFVISDNNDPDCAGKVDPLTSYTRKGSANVGTLRDVEIISTLSTGQKLRVVRLKYWFNSAKLCKCQLKTLSQYGLTALHEAAHNVGWGGAYKDDNDPKFDNLPPDIVGHPSGWGVPSGGDVK